MDGEHVRNAQHAAATLIQTMSRGKPLSMASVEALQRVCRAAQFARAGDPLGAPDAPPSPYLILSGWAADERVLRDGRRQILRLFLPSDLSGLRIPGQPTVSNLAALTDVTYADVSALASAVNDGTAPAEIAAAWRALGGKQDERLLTHLTRLGRFSALERTGHLLVELFERLFLSGHTSGQTMPLPLTQEQMADHLGLSIVHLNRVLQQLKRDGYVDMRSRQMTFRNLAGLAQVCDYPLHPHILARQAPVTGRLRAVGH
jgi:CRP-like cAMP-binding protein